MRIRRFAAPDGNGKHFGRKPYFLPRKKATKRSSFFGLQKLVFGKNPGMNSRKKAQILIEIIFAQFHVEFLRIKGLDNVLVDTNLQGAIEITKRRRSG